MCLAVNTWRFMFSPNFSEYPNILSLNLRDKAWKKLWWYAVYHFCKVFIFLSWKNMGRGWGAGCVSLIWRCSFSKNVFSRERVNLCFFVTFNVIVSHIFHENLIEVSPVIWKIWRTSSSLLTIFIKFLDFSIFYCYKKANDISI